MGKKTPRDAAPTAVAAPNSERNGAHSESSPEASKPEVARKFSERTSRAFLPDEVIASHPVFRFLIFLAHFFFYPFHSWTVVDSNVDKEGGSLFYGRHSTHNYDIMATVPTAYEKTGRVSRALFHRLLIKYWPFLKYFGGVPGHRESAVALLREGFWCAVIPGGSNEAMVGHANCYRLVWPKVRKGFARVAMQANVPLVPYFTRNVEESRFNIVHELWHLSRAYRPVEYLKSANIPVFSHALYVLAEVVWFATCAFSVPLPVRCTMVFGDPVPYQQDEPVEAVVARCKDALQTLIDTNQPHASQGRNYARALGERWQEWRELYPQLTATVEKATPFAVKAHLARSAAGGKKQQ